MRVRRVPSRATFFTLVMCVVSALLKSTTGANKFVCVLDRACMKLEAKLVDLVGIEVELLKGI